jgi:uncharacterized phage protein (TIGR01671 family)
MREIKFRAWDKKSKTMFYQGSSDLESLQSFIFHWGNGELMQYVGLQDKWDNDIYEGDIVYCFKDKFGKNKHEYWTVRYRDSKFVVYNQLNSERDIEIDITESCYPIFTTDGKEYWVLEVIGNVHESKDLIK